MSKVTLRDIAKKTGYSVNTVSRALRGKDGVGPEAAEQIKKVAARLNYVPDGVARSLRSKNTRTIQVVLGDLSNPYFAIVTQSIEKTARKHGYQVLITNTEETYAFEEGAILTGLEKNVDGFIILPVQEEWADIQFLKEREVPVVLVGRHFPDLDVDHFISDDVRGGYLAARHLIEKGHQSILCLAGASYLSCARERIEGYQMALEEAGLTLEPKMIAEWPVRTGYTFSAIDYIVKNERQLPFTAILAFSDLMALEAIAALNRRGVKVPDDVAVVGYDDIEHYLPLPFNLTSIRIPITDMGREATECLLAKIEGKQDKTVAKIYPVELVVRGTT